MLMQQNYSLTEAECIRLVLDAQEKRQSPRHQQTLARLRTLARMINL